jgi:hypothetical protein
MSKKSSNLTSSAEVDSSSKALLVNDVSYKASEPENIIELGKSFKKEGKVGSIIWLGDQGQGIVFKVRWEDGSVEFIAKS